MEQLCHTIFQRINSNPQFYIDLAQSYGIMFRYQKNQDSYIPISFFPATIKASQLRQLCEIHQIYQKLLWKLSEDLQQCNQIFASISKDDEFVKNILKLYNQTFHDKKKQQIVCSIVRNDYLKDQVLNQWKLVEFNSVAASLGNLNYQFQKMIKFLYESQFAQEYRFLKQQGYNIREFEYQNSQNVTIEAFKLYGNSNAVVLIIPRPGQVNLFDHRAFQLYYLKNKIETIRASFQQLRDHLILDEETRIIKYKNKEIAIFYFRAGYNLTQYKPETWKVRRDMQLSRAFKIPTLGMQLVNFKRVQLELGKKQFLKKYLEQQEVNKVLKIATPMFDFDNIEQSQEMIKSIKDLKSYVLKPNLQGGGNNIFNEQVEKALKLLSPQQRKKYILMKKIQPTQIPSIMLMKTGLIQTRGISEMGIFGGILTNKNEIIMNKVGGYLIRTKKYDADQCGICAGFGVLDSLMIKQNE